jgi:hypothetical protein
MRLSWLRILIPFFLYGACFDEQYFMPNNVLQQ